VSERRCDSLCGRGNVLGLRRTHHLIVLAAVVGLLVAPAAARATGDCVPGAWPAAQAAPAAEVVRLVNQHRASIGLGPLLVSPTLTRAAVWKSRHMAAYDYIAHDDPAPPVARTWIDRVHTCAYPLNAYAGENIAIGARTPNEVMAGWLTSTGHRENIESPQFTAIGVGVAGSGSRLSWTQDFGSVADAGSALPPPPPAPPPTPPPTTSPAAPTTVVAGRCRRAKRSRRAVSCRVRVSALVGSPRLRARLVRHGRTVARGSLRVRVPGTVRVRLAGKRKLRAGRYRLAVRVGSVSARSAVRLRPARR
jgi:uncharacterized protein YkwD